MLSGISDPAERAIVACLADPVLVALHGARLQGDHPTRDAVVAQAVQVAAMQGAPATRAAVRAALDVLEQAGIVEVDAGGDLRPTGIAWDALHPTSSPRDGSPS